MIGRTNWEFFFTGFWLGASQVSLAFHLLYSQGASVVYYFALIALWLLGSVLSLLLLGRASLGPWLKASCLALFLASVIAARTNAFDSLSLILLVSAIAAFGLYAGWFLKFSVGGLGDVRAVMLHENNGFIAGYAAGGVLLFFSVVAIDLLSLFCGCLLLAHGLLRQHENKAQLDS